MGFGMHYRGSCSEQLTEKVMTNLNNQKELQGMSFQLSMYGFGTHNAYKMSGWSAKEFLDILCNTMTDIGVNIY